MEPTGIVVLVVATTVVLGLTTWRIVAVRRRNAQRRLTEEQQLAQQRATHKDKLARFHQVLDRTRQGDRETIDQVAQNVHPHYWRTFGEEYAKDELTQALAAGQLVADTTRVQPIYAAWQAATDVSDVLANLLLLHRCVRDCYTGQTRQSVVQKFDISLERLESLINEALNKKCDELAEGARGGDYEAFVLLNQLYHDTRDQGRKYTSDPYYRVRVKPVSRPDDWNDLVNRYLRDPNFSEIDIEDIARKRNVARLTPTVVAHMAADADTTNDGWLAKVVIACGMHDPQVREIIGDLWGNMFRVIAYAYNPEETEPSDNYDTMT